MCQTQVLTLLPHTCKAQSSAMHLYRMYRTQQTPTTRVSQSWGSWIQQQQRIKSAAIFSFTSFLIDISSSQLVKVIALIVFFRCIALYNIVSMGVSATGSPTSLFQHHSAETATQAVRLGAVRGAEFRGRHAAVDCKDLYHPESWVNHNEFNSRVAWTP